MNFWRSKFFDVKQLTDGIAKRGEREVERKRQRQTRRRMAEADYADFALLIN